MEEGSRRQYGGEEDPLAYGDFHAPPEDPAEIPAEEGDFDGVGGNGERGIVGDTYRKLRSKYQQGQGDGGGSSNPSSGLGSFIFHKLHDAVNEIGAKLEHGTSSTAEMVTQDHNHPGVPYGHQHRYGSFADQRVGNDAKWFVDGCGYMWAVSKAIEQANTSIWILDCKLSDWTSCHYHSKADRLSGKGGYHLNFTFDDLHREMSHTGSIVCFKQRRSAVSR